MTRRESLREDRTHILPKTGLGGRATRSVINKSTCEDCPIRRSTENVQVDSFSLLDLLKSGEANTDVIEEFAESEREEHAVTNLAKCARKILAGTCDMYGENQEYGYYVGPKFVEQAISFDEDL